MDEIIKGQKLGMTKTKYTEELLKKFKLDDCKIMSTPMHLTCNMRK